MECHVPKADVSLKYTVTGLSKLCAGVIKH